METYLFFGSFNPIHNGHVALVRHILTHTESDIWIIVSPHNPHKDTRLLAPFEDRIKMVRLSFNDIDKRLLVSDIEDSLPRPSYTINTIKKLKELYPDRKFLLLAGSDIADTIHTWYKYDELCKLINFRIYPRKESERNKCSEELEFAPVLECSSTNFRETKDYSLLPEIVSKYIKENNLY